MPDLISFFREIPLWAIIAVGAGLALILLVWLIISLVRNHRFRRELQVALESGEQFSRHFSTLYIRSRARILIKLARERGDSSAIILSGLNAIWLEDFVQRPREGILRYLLEFVPGQALFPALQASLSKPALVKLIVEKTGETGMRVFARSCTGDDFDGKANLEILRDFVDEIREIAGDPEWRARYFAIKVLLEDGSERSLRPVLDAFEDSHPLIRKTVISLIDPAKVDFLYRRLQSSLIHDAAYEVRAAAWERIQREFLDQYQVDLESLNTTEAYHVLDFLDAGRDDHVNLAIELLEKDNLELRHPAAVFLDQTGWLLNALNEAELSDQKDLKRRLKLLGKAAEVQVSDFLLHTATRPASLLLALQLMEKYGDRSIIPPLVERAFNQFNGSQEEVWQQAVRLLNLRQTDSGTALYIKELDRHRYNARKSAYMLSQLRITEDKQLAELLMSLLMDQRFESREELVEALSRFQIAMILPELKEILRAGRGEYSHRIRITALRVIASYQLPYLVQMILEQLPTLPLEEARDFARLLQSYSGSEFSARVDDLLSQPDGKIRAAVIASVPLDEKKRIIKEIRAAIKDAEPEVRIAAVWALIEVEETRTINQSLDLLRDPVSRVREAAARAIGTYGSDSSVQEMYGIITQPTETESVQRAGIAGLGASDSPKAVELLVNLLGNAGDDDELLPDIQKAIAWKKDAKRIRLLLEHMKDAEAELRDRIVANFVIIGEEAESAIRELLEQDIASLKPYLVEILEETGYIEAMIRQLSNRDPRIRRSAADILARVGSLSAFRGIVLAARDPDEEVRVQVTKALEYLNSAEGNELLAKLQSDPDRRVRKYTSWALQRIAAKAIDD
jgi:HEAT repeat protein